MLPSIDCRSSFLCSPAWQAVVGERVTLHMKVLTGRSEANDPLPRRTLLIVAPYFPPVIGGLEQYVSRLADQLRRRHNWRVIVAASGDRGGPDRLEIINGITVYRLGYTLKISHTPLSALWLRRIRHIIDLEGPDLVNVHLPVPGLADAAAYVVRDIPLVATYHTISMHKGNLRHDIAIWIYERIMGRGVLSKATRIICSSSAVREFLRPYSGKSVVIPPAVDSELFSPGEDTSGQRLLFVGNLSKSHTHKGLSYLLKALAEPPCQQVCLDIVGDGDGRPGYESQCRLLGISGRVCFHGRLDGPALVKRYRMSYALVQPSTNDSLPTTLLEAMACGLPVIASRVGAMSSIVRPGFNGWVVQPGDTQSLARAIEELTSDLAKAAQYGRAGRELVKSLFTVEESGRSHGGHLRGCHERVWRQGRDCHAVLLPPCRRLGKLRSAKRPDVAPGRASVWWSLRLPTRVDGASLMR